MHVPRGKISAPSETGALLRRGITIEDLPWIYREQYLYAVEQARALYDPCLEWRAFSDYLWNSLIRVFGLEADDVPIPPRES